MLNLIDTQVQATIERVTNDTYLNGFDAMQGNIDQRKSCMPDILLSHSKVFVAVNAAIKQCSYKIVGFDGFYTLTSLGLQIPTDTLMKLNSCASGQPINKTAAENCIKSVI